MKNILLIMVILGAFGCSKITNLMDKTEQIPDKMDNLNKGMGETNAAIRLQKMGVFLSMLLDDKNFGFLAPFPGQLMASGKLMGQEINAEEMLELTYVTIKQINTYDIVTNPLLDSSNDFVKVKFDHDKLGLYMGITIVAGYLKDSVVEEIISHIYTSDRYKEAGFQVLALRTKFFNDVMLGGSLYTEKFKTLGHVKYGIEYNSKIERIAKLPYTDELKVSIVGMLTPEMNEAMSFAFDPSIVNQNWSKIKTLAEAGFEVKPMSGNTQADAAEAKRQRDAFTSMMSLLDQKIKAAQTVH